MTVFVVYVLRMQMKGTRPAGGGELSGRQEFVV